MGLKKKVKKSRGTVNYIGEEVVYLRWKGRDYRSIRDTNIVRHKHKNPRVHVYFMQHGHDFKLLEAINFGTKSE